MQVDTEPLPHGVVSMAGVRCDVGIGVDGGSATRPSDLRHHVSGIALEYQKPPSVGLQALVQSVQVGQELAAPGRTGSSVEAWIEHEEGSNSIGVFAG